MSLLRISVWPWSFSLSVSICGHSWLLCGLSWPPRDRFIIFVYSILWSIELPIDYVVYQIIREQWKPQWVLNWVKRHRFLRFIRCISKKINVECHHTALIMRNSTVLTPEGQSSERNLSGTIVPWRDIFDNDLIPKVIPKEIFWKLLRIINAIRKLLKFCILHPPFPSSAFVQSTLTSVQTQNVPWRENCPWGVQYLHRVKT